MTPNARKHGNKFKSTAPKMCMALFEKMGYYMQKAT